MNERIPLSWKSIRILPALVAVSASAGLIVSLHHRLSVHAGIGLSLAVLAAVEIGYLVLLLMVTRRDSPCRLPATRLPTSRGR